MLCELSPHIDGRESDEASTRYSCNHLDLVKRRNKRIRCQQVSSIAIINSNEVVRIQFQSNLRVSDQRNNIYRCCSIQSNANDESGRVSCCDPLSVRVIVQYEKLLAVCRLQTIDRIKGLLEQATQHAPLSRGGRSEFELVRNPAAQPLIFRVHELSSKYYTKARALPKR